MAAPVPLGIVLGLLIGKPIGVLGAIAIMVRYGLAPRPKGTSWRQLIGLAVLCGIGFTMSLFIAGLAFGEGSAADLAAKIGILTGSVLSAIIGYAILARATRQPAVAKRA